MNVVVELEMKGKQQEKGVMLVCHHYQDIRGLALVQELQVAQTLQQ
jgi:hypothetical protein